MKININIYDYAKSQIQNDEFCYSKVLFDYQQNNPNLYVVQKIGYVNSDDNLNCAEPWHSYGNYKLFGIADPQSLYSLWNYINREMFVYCKENGKFYSTKDEGNSWDHSENNLTPGRTALAEEVKSPSEALKSSVEMFFDESLKKSAYDYWKRVHLDYLHVVADSYNKKIEESAKKLETLKTEHPRAKKQIEIAVKEYEKNEKYHQSILEKINILND